MLNEILSSCREHWHDIEPEWLFPEKIRYILQSRSRVLIFLFDASRPKKRLAGVVKICRNQEDTVHFVHAVTTAIQVRQALYGEVRTTVPRMALLEPLGREGVSLEQALPGAPMRIPAGLFASREHRTNITAFRHWLIAFQEQLKKNSPACPVGLAPLQTEIENSLAAMSLSPGCVLVLSQAIKEIVGITRCATWRCGDLHHSNILIQDGQVSGVIDWEGVQFDQLGVSDWLQFAYQYMVDYWRIMRPGMSPIQLGKLATDSLMLSPSSALTQLMREETVEVLKANGYTSSHLPALLTAFLIRLWWPWEKDQLLQHAVQRLDSDNTISCRRTR